MSPICSIVSGAVISHVIVSHHPFKMVALLDKHNAHRALID